MKPKVINIGYNLHVQTNIIEKLIMREMKKRHRKMSSTALYYNTQSELLYIQSAHAVAWTSIKHFALMSKAVKEEYVSHGKFKRKLDIKHICECINHESLHILIHHTENDKASWDWDNIAYQLGREGYL